MVLPVDDNEEEEEEDDQPFFRRAKVGNNDTLNIYVGDVQKRERLIVVALQKQVEVEGPYVVGTSDLEEKLLLRLIRPLRRKFYLLQFLLML